MLKLRPAPVLVENRLEAAGIRKLEGKHLVLYTDLPESAEVDALCDVFDQALPQWVEYFQIDAKRVADWRPQGYLIKDRQRFESIGVMTDVPPFLNGYSRDLELWLYEQPTDYYRRHLLLHEGTHAFMNAHVGGSGPPWYSEAMAELLATHQVDQGRVALNHFPAARDELSQWGRIKIVRDAFQSRRGLFLSQIFAYPNHSFLKNEPYGWCWAAAAFLDGHPRYRDRFRTLSKFVTEDFDQRLEQLYAEDARELAEEWQVFVAELDYGYDLQRTVIEFVPGKPLSGSTKVTLAADRGWQSSGIRLEAGMPYRIKAHGRYGIANEPKVWECEPNGVSIRYHGGHPLGILIGALQTDESATDNVSGLVRPVPIGLGIDFTPETSGTLYLKINDSPAELEDNSGTLEVGIESGQ
jgi:hypothetical protein